MMASNLLQAKRISYTLAVLIFQDLDSRVGSKGGSSIEELNQLLTLTPNVFRKDF